MSIKPNNQYIKIFVQEQQFKLRRDLLLSESESNQIKNHNDFTNNKALTLQLPEWVTKDIYLLLEEYFKVRNVQFLKPHIQNNSQTIKLLRLSDFLALNKFHQLYINDVIIPNLTHQNCLLLLDQTQKKLRNMQNGPQCWFSLLNATINYVSIHLQQLYQKQPNKIRKMNDKILNQILDRAIRLDKKSNMQAKHSIFKLIMQTKNMDNVQNLLANLRNLINHKKINPKIHAKLSWKLQNLSQIKDKKTKQFKFLDLDWFLLAQRKNYSRQLKITLNLIKSTNHLINQFTNIAIFYTKLISTIQSTSHQSDIKMHYVNLSQPQPIQLLVIDEETEKQIGNRKLQLNIYCSIQQVYTFVMNYVILNFDKLQQITIYDRIIPKNLSVNQLLIIIQIYKQIKQYQIALYLTQQLIQIKNNNLTQPIKQSLVDGYELKELTVTQRDILYKLTKTINISSYYTSKKQSLENSNASIQQLNKIDDTKKKQYVKNQKFIEKEEPYKQQLEFQQEKKFKKPNSNPLIPSLPSNNSNKTIQKIQSKAQIKLQQRKQFEVLKNSRNDSRTRVRKIFQSSPNSKVQMNNIVNPSNYSADKVNQKSNNSLIQQMLSITDIKNYLYDPGSDFAKIFN